MKRLMCYLILAVGVLFAVQPAQAQTIGVTVPAVEDLTFRPGFEQQRPATFKFLSVAPSARIAGMANTYTSVSDDVDAIFVRDCDAFPDTAARRVTTSAGPNEELTSVLDALPGLAQVERAMVGSGQQCAVHDEFSFEEIGLTLLLIDVEVNTDFGHLWCEPEHVAWALDCVASRPGFHARPMAGTSRITQKRSQEGDLL